MSVDLRTDCVGIDWLVLKATLAADDFDNGLARVVGTWLRSALPS